MPLRLAFILIVLSSSFAQAGERIYTWRGGNPSPDPYSVAAAACAEMGVRPSWFEADRGVTAAGQFSCANMRDSLYFGDPYAHFTLVLGSSIVPCPAGQHLVGGACEPFEDKGKGNGEPGCCAGNPINLGTGNKFQRDVDYLGRGPFPLRFERFYSSSAASRLGGPVGNQWRHTYERGLHRGDGNGALAASNQLIAQRADGKSYTFVRVGGAWTAHPDVPFTLAQTADGFVLTDPSDVAEVYSAEGRLVRLVRRDGQLQTLEYDAAGRLIAVADGYGRELRFELNTLGRIARLIDPAGGVYSFSYDKASQMLTSVGRPNGSLRGYHYEVPGEPSLLTGITDENGARYATFGYDAQLRAVSSEHAGGVDRVTVGYDANGAVVTDPLGTTRALDFSLKFGVRKLDGAEGRCNGCGATALAMTYDANGYLASRTDFGGTITTFAHDARGLETRRTEAAGTAQARTIETEWHAGFRLPLRVTEPGRETTYAYDAAGNRTAKTVRDLASGATRTTTWTYNAVGQVLTIDGPRTDVADVTTYAYDGQGNLASVTNALGQVTRFTQYDAHGNPLRIEDPNGVVTTMAYDARQRLVRRTVAGAATEFVYDGVGNLTRVTLPDGSALDYTYDPAHRLVRVADSLGNRIDYTLDAAGNRVAEQVRDPGGALVRAQARAYDALAQLVRDEDGTGRGIAIAYDAEGKRASTTDDLGRTTSFAYDALDRLTTTTDALGGQTRYGYDARDNLVRVADPRGVTTDYAYDGFGGVTATLSPDAGTTAYAYDAAGNRVQQTDARGVVRTFEYDALNRLVAIRHADPRMDVVYAYDQGANGVGRMARIDDPSGRTEYAYDARGNVIEVRSTVDATTLVTAYEYDAADRLVAMTYPSGERIEYPRDAAGRIAAVTRGGLGGGLASGIAWRAFGPIERMALGDGSLFQREFDLGGRLVRQTTGAQALRWAHDPAGNIIGMADDRDGARSQQFGYDALDRLIAATGGYGAQQFAYDAVGNRTQSVEGGSTTQYAYDAVSNRLAAVGGRVFGYDAAGNTVADGEQLFVYDAWGRLAEVQQADGDRVATYAYNALGQRVKKSVGSQGPDYAALAAQWQATADQHVASAAALSAQAATAGEAASEQESIAFAQTQAWSTATEAAAAQAALEHSIREDAAATYASALADAEAVELAGDAAAARAAEAERLMIEAAQQAAALGAQAKAAETEAAVLEAQSAARTAEAAAKRLEADALEDFANEQTELWSSALALAEAALAREAMLRAEAAALLTTVQAELDKAAWFRSRKVVPEQKPQDALFNANMERQAQHFEGKVKDVTDAAAALIAEADAAHQAALDAQAQAAAAEAAAIAARAQVLALRAAADAAELQALVLDGQRAALLAQAEAWREEAAARSEFATAQMALWSEATLEAQSLRAQAAAIRSAAEAALASALIEAEAAHTAMLSAQEAAQAAEQTMIAAQQLAQTYRAEQQQAAAEAAVQAQLAQEAQVQADHYAALAADGTGEFSETLFAYDLSGHLIGEYLADGSVLREYVWLQDQPLAMLVPGGGVFGGTEALYYHVDQLNTPQRLTDATGQVVWDAVMQPFGEVEVVAAEVEQNLRFPGQYFDAESGLHYNYFRDYDPVLGRYRESDPIGLAGGVNTFAYVVASPIRFSDPLGLWLPDMHRRMTREAAIQAGCEKLADDLGEASHDADSGTQGPEDSHQHHMAAPGQSPAEASESYEQFVSDQMAVGTPQSIGTAVHAVQDGYAPGHRDFQTWNGVGQEFAQNPLGPIGHALQDTFASPASYDAAVAATRRAIEEQMKKDPCLCK